MWGNSHHQYKRKYLQLLKLKGGTISQVETYLDALYATLPIRRHYDDEREKELTSLIAESTCFFYFDFMADGYGDFRNASILIFELAKYFRWVCVYFHIDRNFLDLESILESLEDVYHQYPTNIIREKNSQTHDFVTLQSSYETFEFDKEYSLTEYLESPYIQALRKYADDTICDSYRRGGQSSLYLQTYLSRFALEMPKNVEVTVLANHDDDARVQEFIEKHLHDQEKDYLIHSTFYTSRLLHDPKKLDFSTMNNSLRHTNEPVSFGLTPYSLGVKTITAPDDVTPDEKYTFIYTNASMLCEILLGDTMSSQSHYDQILIILLILYYCVVNAGYDTVKVYCSKTFLEVLRILDRYYVLPGYPDAGKEYTEKRYAIPLDIHVTLREDAVEVRIQAVKLVFEQQPSLPQSQFLRLIAGIDDQIPAIMTGDHSYMEAVSFGKKVLYSNYINNVKGVEKILEDIDKNLTPDAPIRSLEITELICGGIEAFLRISQVDFQNILSRYFEAQRYLYEYLFRRHSDKINFENNFQVRLLNKVNSLVGIAR